MILTYQTVELNDQAPGLIGLKKHVELAARTCYKSEDKITEDSYERIFKMLCENEHLAALEHGTVYMFVPIDCSTFGLIAFYKENPYSAVVLSDTYAYITTNYRVIHEHKRFDDLQYMLEDGPLEFHKKRVTAWFYADISVTREANRHRKNSICEESTIYCNYSKDKFGGELRVSTPVWLTPFDTTRANQRITGHHIPATGLEVCKAIHEGKDSHWGPVEYWLAANIMAEFFYLKLIEKGWKAKQARTILPLDTKSELVHTAFIDDWKHFFKLRCKEAHPQIKALANKLQDLFYERKYITESDYVK